jgi:hypothetical protein
VGIEIFNITQIIANAIKKKIKETLFERWIEKIQSIKMRNYSKN